MIDEREGAFTILRATVEAGFEIPVSVAITSANANDGKTEVAIGLARSFSRAGYATLLIDANPTNPSIGPETVDRTIPVPANLEDPSALAPVKVNAFLDVASIASDALVEATPAATLRAFFDTLRGRYAVTIWDTGNAFVSPLALQCAAVSDATFLSVRYGRNPNAQDARIVGMLEAVGARIAGVVPTAFPPERKRRGDKRAPRFDSGVIATPVRRAEKSTA
jgi:Mrp family chromosome partitioning ATPase